MNSVKAVQTPWYRDRWPWLLMLGPAVVVVAGFVTLWLAVVSDDGLVADDYYKRGLAINQVLSRKAEARAQNTRAQVIFAPSGDRVRVILAGERRPAGLAMRLVHPTRAGLDQAVVLKAAGGGTYEGALAPAGVGRFRILLEDDQGQWQVSGDWPSREELTVTLSAN
jgi:hypothetical protein